MAILQTTTETFSKLPELHLDVTLKIPPALLCIILTRPQREYPLCRGEPNDDVKQSLAACHVQSAQTISVSRQRGKLSAFTEEPPIHLGETEGQDKPKITKGQKWQQTPWHVWGRIVF